MHLSDSELMKKVVTENCEQSFEELVIRYRKSLIRFAFRYSGDYYAAEDLAQEALARVYITRYNFHSDEFKPYLLKILRNLCTDRHRKRLNMGEQVLSEDLPYLGPSPEDSTVLKEAAQLVRTLVASLKEQYRTALYLLEYEQLSYKEIAKVMGLSIGQVRMLIYRGKKKLRQLGQKELKHFDV